jgi:hypothetical protein
MGGAAAVDGTRTLELKGHARRIFPGGQETKFESTTTILLSGAVRQDLDLAFGRLTTVWTNQGAFTDMGNGPVLLPDVQRAELEAGFRRNLVVLLQARKQPDFHAFARGAVSVGSTPAEEIEAHFAGQATTLAIDRATGRILRSRSVSPMEARSGKRETSTEYSDYRMVDGLTYPFSATTSIRGEPAAAIQLESVRVNAAVEPTLFEPSGTPVSAEETAETAAPVPTPTPTPTPRPR